MNFEKLIIYKDNDILNALEKLNKLREISRLILFVVDDSLKVIGSLTDGDIRRSILKNNNLNISVKDICNKNFLFLNENKSGHFNLRNFKNQDILILPVIDKFGRISSIIDIEKFSCVLPVECIIMAGGRGKRLSPLTDTIPKPLLPLNDKSIIEHNIDNLLRFGINRIHITLNYLGKLIEERLLKTYKNKINLNFVRESKPLGTIGAISLIEKIDSNSILIINADTITNFDLESFYLDFINSKSDMSIGSNDYKVDVPYAILESSKNNIINKISEKPSFVYPANAGIYLIKKEFINLIPKNKFFDATDLIDKLLNLKKKITYKSIRGYWIDIGSPNDYKRAIEFFKYKNN